jgi:hypothetical protein
MAQRTRANLISTINALIADNTSKAITPSVLRSLLTDFADSNYNVLSDLQTTYTATVSISSAEILNSFTTPKVLVSAPGANKVIVPTSIITKFKWNSIAYATNTTIDFKVGSIATGTLSSAFLAATASTVALTNSFNNFVTGFNTDLVFQVRTGNPTAGDSAITVYITYNIIDMS